MNANEALARGRCRIYALDVPYATGLELHHAYTPCDWEHNQFAADTDLHSHLTRRQFRHPWLVRYAAHADVVIVTGHGFDR